MNSASPGSRALFTMANTFSTFSRSIMWASRLADKMPAAPGSVTISTVRQNPPQPVNAWRVPPGRSPTTCHTSSGNRWVICPAIPESRRPDLAGWQEVAASLDRIGERCAARGLLFGYHNHNFEFPPIPDGNGRRGLDVVLGETDPRELVTEIATPTAALPAVS